MGGADGSEGAKARRVLVVEDDADVADSLRTLLELEGHAVAVARSGAEALDEAREGRPEVILCDIGLPGELDGYDVARRVRADSELPNVRLVALTGYAHSSDRARAREAGFDDHLTKPIQLGELRRILAGS